MSTRYRYEGPPGCCRPTRTWIKWLIAYDILDLGKLCLRKRQNIHVYEETVTRTINHSTREIKEDKFRIDITQRLMTEIMLENIDNNK